MEQTTERATTEESERQAGDFRPCEGELSRTEALHNILAVKALVAALIDKWTFKG